MHAAGGATRSRSELAEGAGEESGSPSGGQAGSARCCQHTEGQRAKHTHKDTHSWVIRAVKTVHMHTHKKNNPQTHKLTGLLGYQRHLCCPCGANISVFRVISLADTAYLEIKFIISMKKLPRKDISKLKVHYCCSKFWFSD